MPAEPPEIAFDEDVDTDAVDRIDGRFRIVRQVARGGMSEVYLAEQEAVGRDVALKILKPPQHSDDPNYDFLSKFRDEARRLASFQHPNVVTLYDFGETHDGRVFLAMEFVDGPRVTDLLRKGPLDTVRALRILEQVTKALRYTHQRGVIHRDVSPANILVTTDPDGDELAKLIDFGISAEKENHEGDGDIIVGSPSCMPPEQIRGEPLDVRADVYSVGIVAFRMITGRYPFRGNGPTETLRAHLNEPVPSLARTIAEQGGGRHVPKELDALVTAALAKDRNDRPATMDEVVTIVEGILDTLDPHRTRTLHLPPPPPGPRRWGLLAGMAILAMMLGAVVALATREVAVAPEAPAVAASPDATEPTPGAEANPVDAAGAAEGATAATEEAAPPTEAPPKEAAPAAAPEPKPAPAKPAPRRTSGTTSRPRPAPRPKKPAKPADTPEDVPQGYKGMPEF